MQILRRSAKAKSDQQDVIRGIRQTPENVKFLDESAIRPLETGGRSLAIFARRLRLLPPRLSSSRRVVDGGRTRVLAWPDHRLRDDNICAIERGGR
jgi:hypothetical protein